MTVLQRELFDAHYVRFSFPVAYNLIIKYLAYNVPIFYSLEIRYNEVFL